MRGRGPSCPAAAGRRSGVPAFRRSCAPARVRCGHDEGRARCVAQPLPGERGPDALNGRAEAGRRRAERGARTSRVSSRAFVLRHTRLRPVPGLEPLRLHQADEILPLWRAVQLAIADPDAALPYWGFAWSGGLAIARHLREDPALVAGRTVLDLGTGSGLVAIAASKAGARRVRAVDIDPFAVAAATLNASANDARIDLRLRDVLDDPAPDVDVILAGDCWYEATMASRVWAWLRRARGHGATVILGDPGRRYLPGDGLRTLAAYEVRTTTDLEDLERKRAWVYALEDEATTR